VYGRAVAQIPRDGADGVDGVGGGAVPREEDVEVREVRLAEAVVEFLDLGGRGASAFELTVACVVAWDESA
jgi:hypothetical protein